MRFYHLELTTSLKIPNSDGLVVGCGEEVFAGRVKYERSNPVVVTVLRLSPRETSSSPMVLRRALTNVRKHTPVNASHNRMDLSRLPVATKQPGVLALSSPARTWVTGYTMSMGV